MTAADLRRTVIELKCLKDGAILTETAQKIVGYKTRRSARLAMQEISMKKPNLFNYMKGDRRRMQQAQLVFIERNGVVSNAL